MKYLKLHTKENIILVNRRTRKQKKIGKRVIYKGSKGNYVGYFVNYKNKKYQLHIKNNYYYIYI